MTEGSGDAETHETIVWRARLTDAHARRQDVFFPVSEWLPAFVLTLAVEIPIVLLLLRGVEPDLPRMAVLVAFANLATHPSVWFVFTQLFLAGTVEYVIAAEGWAVAIEGLFYALVVRGITVRQAIVVTVVANAASFAVGRLVGAPVFELFG